MKILCLIIDSVPHEPHEAWRDAYDAHRQIWKTCLDANPGIDGYFLRADPSLASDHVIEGRRFTIRGPEGYGTIFEKTRRAIEVLLSDHDYVIRTNLSSIFDFPLLLRQDLPKRDLYLGDVRHDQGVDFVSGSGMILSRDVAKKLLTPVPGLVLNACDDVAIYQILHARGVRTQHRPMFAYDYARGLEQLTIGSHFHYRLRDESDPQRLRERVVTEHVYAEICRDPSAPLRRSMSMESIEILYLAARRTPSDINEHVERLRQLGEICPHVTEFGVRTGVSTTALVAARPKKVVGYDLRRYPEAWLVEQAAKAVGRLEEAARAAGVEFVLHFQDVLSAIIEPTDLLLIDTLHTYDQLRQELALHAAKVRKYIVLHDTETFGQVGELPGSRGLWPAVTEFLIASPEWILLERRKNNNGLAVLVRKSLLL